MKWFRGTASLLILTLISTLFLTGACGRKGDPVAPEDYQSPKEKTQDPGGETR